MFLSEDTFSDQSSFDDYISVSPSANMDSTIPNQETLQQTSQPEQILVSASPNGNESEILQIPEPAYAGHYLPLPSMPLGSAGSDHQPFENGLTVSDMGAQG